MGGLGFLLKSMGINIDPEQVERDYLQIKTDVAMWGNVVIELKAQMDRIEAQNTELLAHIKKEIVS